MTDEPSVGAPHDPNSRRRVCRRQFLAASGGVGATLLAGCSSESSSDDGDNEDDQTGDDTDRDDQDNSEDEGEGETETPAGANFRLLITDMPADIGDFDRLDVSFSHARVFDGGPDEEEENDEEEESEEGKEDEDRSEESSNERVQHRRGFYRLDLDGATVDLTQVVGDNAVSVFDGNLDVGSYNKLELHVSAVEGIVDGEVAEIKVPSEKLQITHSFEIQADEPTEFVFDINVVRRGQALRYNLKPVISGSGVRGRDVEVEELEESE